MAKEMLINVSAGEECRIALLENNKLEELYMERTSNTSHVGNIYKGKVTNVEPSIQAAFVDFGIGRNGFLHISDLMPTYFGKRGHDAPAEKVGQKLGRRDRPPIQQCLRKGDEIVVQIIKEGIGTKGPTLSTYLSIPGRVLVMMPGMAKMGVSKKIEDEAERTRLRKILDGLTPPKDCGFIIRTAGIGKSKLEIEKDLKYLARLWEQLKKQIEKDKPPVELYTEGDLITRTVRDVFTTDVDSIIVDDKETAKKIKDFIKLAMPRTKNKVELYEEQVPLFHKYELEEVVESMYSRRVPLPSGGSLIIDQTEAVVAIDVNSGKFRDHSDAEMTAFKTDMEAADEIPRQLRLRDMGGVIICDFIDLRFERHRRELEERLFENLKKDRAKTRMLRMSQFGIVEMTRQRMRPSLRKAIYHDCEACQGQGMVKTPESMALDVMRKIRIGLNDAAVVRLQLVVNDEVATYLQNRKRYEMAKLEQDTEKRITVAGDADLAMDDVKFELYDARDGYVYLAELGMALPSTHGQRRDGPTGDRRPRRDERQRASVKPKHDRRDDESLDADDLFAEETEPKAEEVAEPAPAKPGRRGRGKAAPVETQVESLEQTGNDDEASVVDVDEGGDELPGHAPGSFFDPNERDRRDPRGRDRGRGGPGGRERGRGDNRGRGDHRNRDNRPRLDAPDRQDRQPDVRDDERAAPRPPAAERPEAESIIEHEPVDPEVRDDGPPNDAREGEPRNADPGDGAPREGGRRRRRRRGRRGRGRSEEGSGAANPPSGDAALSERSAEDASEGAEVETAEGDAPPRADQGDMPRQPPSGDRDAPRRQPPQGNDPRRNPRGDAQGDRGNRPPQQGGRGADNRRGPGAQQGGGRDARRGSSRADLSHLARESARQDAAGYDPAEDEHATPGNDINFVPAPAKPAVRVDRRGRPIRGARGRGPVTPKRQPPIEGLPDDEELDREAAALEAALAKAREAEMAPAKDHNAGAVKVSKSTPVKPIPRPNITPTGSSDKHLADDEPADGDDVKRPSSYTDLDALPEYDED